MSKSQSKAPQAPEQSQENNSPVLENKDLNINKDQNENNQDPEIPDMDAPAPPKVDTNSPISDDEKEKKDDIQSPPQAPQAPEQSQENNSPVLENFNHELLRTDPEYVKALMEEQPENTGRSNGVGIFHGNKDEGKKYPLDYNPGDNIVVRIALVASSGGQVSEIQNSASIQVFEPSVYEHLKATGAFKGKAVLILNE
ncbi:hypothetical protein BWD42_04090 [Sphingobacterium sp. CZ-UAM]|uniref:hypothetical protein n=1 Tax=Sphingobacterium sp. CZ-UAM TaxID=1933868 RepID=UPI000987A791|nr:hypothetical protein [Sphingobacterium sp. CZ-UAM]OOG19138.1 hypothetical protein BWD42_04090 [Sphingobacterium sp. CZ-UAM]